MSTIVRKIELLDISLVSFLAARRRIALTHLMTFFTYLGDGPLWVVLAAAILVLEPTGSKVAVTLAVAYALELSLYKLSKSLVPRLRPCDFLPRVNRLVVPPDQYSFPSGHTAAAFVMVTVLAHFIPAIALVVLPFALGIGFSRLYLGVHYLSDVLAGAALGLMCGTIAIWAAGLLQVNGP